MEIERKIEQHERILTEHAMQINDLTGIVMGPAPNRDNGLRGTLSKLIDDFKMAMDWARDVWNNKRRDDCIGAKKCAELQEDIKKELNDIIDRLETIEKGDTDVRVAKVNLKGVYFMSFVQVIGTVIVALIAGGAFK